ncbi:MAG: MFS transporter [Solirubrobacteraceae bacterium]
MQDQRQQRLVVLATIGVAFMAGLDLFVVNVAFGDISTDFDGASTADLSWVLNAYAVVYAALLVPFGRLADRHGSRGIFLAGVVVFVAASLACAFSGSVWTLVAFRALQAAGAAAMTPTSLSLLMAALPPERRTGGVRLWAATGAVAAAVGPVVGGLLTELSWHWVFLINLPVGALLLVLAVRHLPRPPAATDTRTPDLIGAGLLSLSVGLLALALVRAETWGWTGPGTGLALLGSVLTAALFVVRSRVHPSPVVPPDLLRIASFRRAVIAMTVFNVAFAALLLGGILWLQQVWGYSAMETGLAVAIGPLFVPITAVLTHRLLPAADPSRLVAVGALLCAVGAALLALTMGAERAYLTDYAPAWALTGIGVGFALPNLMAAGTRELTADRASTGSGIVTMARQIGLVLGVGVLVAIVGDRQGAAAQPGFTATWWACVGVLVATAAIAVDVRPRRRSVVGTDPAYATVGRDG